MKKNNLFQSVYSVVRTVPRGKVITYGDVSKILMQQGSRVSAQLVGFALHANSGSDNAPCHRVVNREGRVAPSFAFGGPSIQKKLLEGEGVRFVDETHVDLIKHRVSV